MKYPCALSLCSEDIPYARSLSGALSQAGVFHFYYEVQPMDQGYMLNQHADIYTSAWSRVYMLRTMTFSRTYPSFELECGRDRENNIVLPLDRDVRLHLPNDYIYTLDPGWHWVDPDMTTSLHDVVDRVVSAIRQPC